VQLKTAAFCDVVSCGPLELYHHSEAWSTSNVNLEVEAAGFSKMFIPFYQTTWHYITALFIITTFRISDLDVKVTNIMVCWDVILNRGRHLVPLKL
jgi:hypothetical protein